MVDLSSVIKALDSVKRLSAKGGEYWMARSIQPILGYDKWDNFDNVIRKAMMACESAEVRPGNHFLETKNMVSIGSGAKREKADYFLTRYACYLIAMNGETTKPEIGIAQSYFAVQARRQEIEDQLTDAERRIRLRDRVKEANKSLAGTAKRAGVKKYPVFQDAGYKGLYEMGLTDIKYKKGIPKNQEFLDCVGRTELAANEFRITQAEEKLVRDGINNEREAIITHRNVGKEVRATIKKLGGTMPEDLPAEEPIKKLATRLRKSVGIKKRLKITTD
jgi:DNA-damage-inducible protein D